MSQWISVHERLPKKLEKVLFVCIAEKYLRNIYMGYLCDEGWDIYLPYHSFKLRPVFNHVTHWMELPECPEYIYEDVGAGFTSAYFENAWNLYER